MTPEEKRLEESRTRVAHWKRWGPYLSDRAWATVREDYSAGGAAWEFFPHDHARSRAYRWGEDGLGGICDRHQQICFALALWNGRDPILKERLFGLTGNEGNHAEDVKEYYFYLDSTPTHSYMKFLYKYPQAEFPYGRLVEENRRRGKHDPEFELIDTGVFDGDRYFDVYVEYAKATPEDILIRIHAVNRGPEAAPLHVLPTIWFRNTWAWREGEESPELRIDEAPEGEAAIALEHAYYGRRWLYAQGAPELLFTDNESNGMRLWGVPGRTPYAKDGINDYLIRGDADAVNPAKFGTKATAHYTWVLPAGESATVGLRFTNQHARDAASHGPQFEEIFSTRIEEANEFYEKMEEQAETADARNIQRQAFAGMMWSKQFYYYDVATWLKGDPAHPPPPPQRLDGRNSGWSHLYNADVISMPDKWEYPWYATWDLAFHCVAIALIDPDFAKEQLILLLREWYMHPNGQLPAYEWAFEDVNPPVHAWAAWRVYKIEKRRRGVADRGFLVRVFHKLLLNFTWWVNRKDVEGNNVFEGGFLGLDNIGVFDRSRPLPTGGNLEQSDGTSWMGMYCLNMLAIALELAREDRAYADIASKFFEHFAYITAAMNNLGGKGISLWDERDGFYYDVLHMPSGDNFHIRIRSMVGLIPLFAAEEFDPDLLERFPFFVRRARWFYENRPHLRDAVEVEHTADGVVPKFLTLVNRHRLRRVLHYMLSEDEFLSPYGVRSLSRYHKDHPYRFYVNGAEFRVGYEPAESTTGLFGGNSNWRGPVWFPVNFLLIESLQRFHHYLGDEFKVEYPSGSGRMMNLWDIAADLSRRLSGIFLRENERRPVYGGAEKFQTDEHWRNLILFYEYFHGDNGAGIGASHQTGWTGLVAKLLQQSGV